MVLTPKTQPDVLFSTAKAVDEEQNLDAAAQRLTDPLEAFILTRMAVAAAAGFETPDMNLLPWSYNSSSAACHASSEDLPVVCDEEQCFGGSLQSFSSNAYKDQPSSSSSPHGDPIFSSLRTPITSWGASDDSLPADWDIATAVARFSAAGPVLAAAAAAAATTTGTTTSSNSVGQQQQQQQQQQKQSATTNNTLEESVEDHNDLNNRSNKMEKNAVSSLLSQLSSLIQQHQEDTYDLYNNNIEHHHHHQHPIIMYDKEPITNTIGTIGSNTTTITTNTNTTTNTTITNTPSSTSTTTTSSPPTTTTNKKNNNLPLLPINCASLTQGCLEAAGDKAANIREIPPLASPEYFNFLQGLPSDVFSQLARMVARFRRTGNGRCCTAAAAPSVIVSINLCGCLTPHQASVAAKKEDNNLSQHKHINNKKNSETLLSLMLVELHPELPVVEFLDRRLPAVVRQHVGNRLERNFVVVYQGISLGRAQLDGNNKCWTVADLPPCLGDDLYLLEHHPLYRHLLADLAQRSARPKIANLTLCPIQYKPNRPLPISAAHSKAF